MHYYKRNLGDYAKKAGRLSMLQHGSYTLLIDACYDREQFPTLEDAIEWTWASTTEEVEAVTFVLRKFFTLENGVYVQKRIQEEIAEYHSKAETNKRIAIERETKRRASSTDRAHGVGDSLDHGDDSTPNHKPITTNQEPITSDKQSAASAPKPARRRAGRSNPDLICLDQLIAEGIPEQVAKDWLAVRKEKNLPLTLTAWENTKEEAAKAQMGVADALKYSTVRSRGGFMASWVSRDAAGQGQGPQGRAPANPQAHAGHSVEEAV